MAAAQAGLTFAQLIYDRQQTRDEREERAWTAQLAASNRIAEAQRMEVETNILAHEAKSDRVRKAEQELAMVRVAAAEGSGMGARLAGEAGFYEGLDLSRIEGNRKRQIDALEAQKAAIQVEAERGIIHADSIYSAQRTRAFLGTIGSGLKIGADEYSRSTRETGATNRRSGAGASGSSYDGDLYFTNGDIGIT